MVNANELRVGNWIADHEAGGYFQVESIYKNAIGVYRASYRNGSIDCTIDSLEEIPLTKDLLVGFGFKDDKANGFSKDSIHLEYIEQVGYVFFINGDVNGASITIEYVHSLQNLYFALKGEELTLN